MNSDLLKQKVAEAALDYIEIGDVIGVGTGSTVNHFIEALHKVKGKIDGTVASSEATASRLKQSGIPVLDLNRTGNLPLYVDGADEATRNRHLIKGGGGALTREKIVAAASEKFVCIVDSTKVVDVLGKFPLPIEVLPFAQSLVSRQLLKFGGLPELRAGFATDSGNIIIDVRNLDMLNPIELEGELDHLAGVVSNGIFARRPADTLLIGYPEEIQSV